MYNVIPRYPNTQKRNIEAFKKSSGRLHKPRKAFEEDHSFERPNNFKNVKNLIDNENDNGDEMDDINNIINIPLPLNSENIAEEEDKQVEQKRCIEVYFEEKHLIF